MLLRPDRKALRARKATKVIPDPKVFKDRWALPGQPEQKVTLVSRDLRAIPGIWARKGYRVSRAYRGRPAPREPREQPEQKATLVSRVRKGSKDRSDLKVLRELPEPRERMARTGSTPMCT